MHTKNRFNHRWAKAAVLVVGVSLAGCSPQFRNHGYIPPQEDLAEITVGTDTRDTVAEKIGIPASSGVLNESGYYYVRMRTRAIGPLAPQEIERQIVAISFSEGGVVQNVERFGLERGKVIQLERRVTDAAVTDRSFLRQLLSNIGRFNPTGFGS